MTTQDLAALPPPEWGACGFDEWHEPHEYVVADADLPVTLPCPGVPGEVAALYLRTHRAREHEAALATPPAIDPEAIREQERARIRAGVEEMFSLTAVADVTFGQRMVSQAAVLALIDEATDA